MVVLLIKIFPGGGSFSSFKVAVSSRLSPTGIIISILTIIPPIGRSYSPQRALSRPRQSVERSVVVLVVLTAAVVIIIRDVWMISQRQLAIRVVDSFGIRAWGHAEDLVRVVSLVVVSRYFSSSTRAKKATSEEESLIPTHGSGGRHVLFSLSLAVCCILSHL